MQEYLQETNSTQCWHDRLEHVNWRQKKKKMKQKKHSPWGTDVQVNTEAGEMHQRESDIK